MKKWRVVREPSVSWLPYLTSSPGACTTRTLLQSASSSSATIIVTPVRTPWPISARWQVMVTIPSGAMATNTSGLSIQPLGMPSTPYFGGSAAKTWFMPPASGETAGRTDCLQEIAARDDEGIHGQAPFLVATCWIAALMRG